MKAEKRKAPVTPTEPDAAPNPLRIGGLKVVSASGWFAARPSGAENIYKICAESFRDRAHLHAIVSEAQEIVNSALPLARRSLSPRASKSADLKKASGAYKTVAVGGGT